MTRSRSSRRARDPAAAAARREGDRPVSAGRRWTAASLVLVAVGVMAAAGLIVRGIVTFGEARAERLGVECRQAHEAGDYAAEERLATQWVGVLPGAAEPLFFLAQAQLGLGKKADAAATLDRLPDGDRLTLEGLGDRADLLFGELKRPYDAAATCERIIRVDPRNVDAHRRLCFFYAVTLQREKLAAQARLAMDLGCELPETYVYLVGSDWLTLSNTMSVNSHWLTESPDDERFLVAQARGFVSNSGLEEDVAADAAAADGDGQREGDSVAVPEHDRRLRQLLERFPGNLELLAYFLQKATTRGDLDEVTALLGQAPPEAEADNRFWRFKGWVHFLADELDEAEESYRRALSIDPYDFSSQHQIAAVLRKAGRLEDAASFSRLAAQGRALRKSILQQPDVRAIPPAILDEMAGYARGCGDAETAERLAGRVLQIRATPGGGVGPPLPRRPAGPPAPTIRPPAAQIP